MDKIMTAITRPPQKESNHSLASERNYYTSDFTPYTGQLEIADILEKLNNIVVATSIDTKSIIDSFIHAASSEIWVSYGDWGSFTIPSEDQHPRLMTFESPSRTQYIKYKILQRPLLDRLETLLNKVEGYKPDKDITWPNEQAYEDAERFIRLLPLSKIHAPEICFAHDGEINFQWGTYDSGVYVDLGLYGDGTYSYYATNHTGIELEDNDINVTQGLPDDLSDMLRI